MKLLILLILYSLQNDYNHVANLANDDFHTREFASKELEDKGIIAYPALLLGSKDQQPERQLRSKYIISEIENPFVASERNFIQDEWQGWMKDVEEDESNEEDIGS